MWGEKVETIRMLLGDYKYNNITQLNLLEFASNIYNKDQMDNNCLHYCYMIDLPEVRQILRDNNLFHERSQKLNRRGQLPTQLRHYIKAEDSNEQSDEQEENEHDLTQQIDELNEEETYGLAILGKGIKDGGKDKRNAMQTQGTVTEAVEEFIAGKRNYDLQDPSDNYRLKFTRDLNRKQKLAHYKTPDYCLVTRADTLAVLRLELESLVSRGGVFYSIYNKVES